MLSGVSAGFGLLCYHCAGESAIYLFLLSSKEAIVNKNPLGDDGSNRWPEVQNGRGLTNSLLREGRRQGASM